MRAAAAAVLLALSACKPAEPPALLSVTFHYEKSVDGKVTGSDFAEEPQTAEFGTGALLPGLEECLGAMRPAEEKTCVLPPEKAYGPRDPAAVETLPLAGFGDMAKDIVPGARVYGMRKGKTEKATVVSVVKGQVALDFNPPDAGKTVTYRLRLISRSR